MIYFREMKLLNKTALIAFCLIFFCSALYNPAFAIPLTLDFIAPKKPISPYIYGLNDVRESFADEMGLPIRRWGGTSSSRYNWRINAKNHGWNWYFQNTINYDPYTFADETAAQWVSQNMRTSTHSLITVPMSGYVAKDGNSLSCAFSTAKYGPQDLANMSTGCGNGFYIGSPLVNDPLDTSVTSTPADTAAWVNQLVTTYGTALTGGIQFYALDNEPGIWHHSQRDIHPLPLKYNDLYNLGVAYASTIKSIDPGALVLGPVQDSWMRYWYASDDTTSQMLLDLANHGGLYFVPWYLQQMSAYQKLNGTRLLDYLDLHFYPQNGVSLSLAGTAAQQVLRLRSTRALWDPTYVDESWIMLAGYNNGIVNLIPLMRNWVNTYYPGTKLAITEYNWGGLEDINGALTQADILGIFGREGLDLATLWNYPEQSSNLGVWLNYNVFETLPGSYAFRLYRNYDGIGGQFGDMSVSAVSLDQAQLSVYAAQRTCDGAMTMIVINKTGLPQIGDITLNGVFATLAQVYLYSNLNLNAITRQPDQPITAGFLSSTFPANSITLLVFTNGDVFNTYTVLPASQTFTAAGGPGSVSVTPSVGNCEWTTTNVLGWVTITSGKRGLGNSPATYSVASNAGAARTGNITIAGQTVTLTQAAAQYTITAANSPSGSGIISGAGINCPGVCSSKYDFGTGVSLTASANIGYDFLRWTGCDSVIGNTCNLNVTGNKSAVANFAVCTYVVSPASQTFTAAGGTGSVTVTPSSRNCAWTAVSSTPSWASITSGNGGTGSGIVNYSVAVNSSVSRTSNLIIAGQVFTINQAEPVPAGPSALTSNATTLFGQTQLQWTDNSFNESGFIVERKTGLNGVYGQVAATTLPVYTDKAPLPNTIYYYRVYAYNNSGASSYSNEVSFAANDTIPPTDGAIVATLNNTQAILTWSGFADAASGLKDYKLIYNNFALPVSCSDGTQLYLGANTTYSHTLVNGTSYFYRLCAVDNAGNISVGVTTALYPLTVITTGTGNGTVTGAGTYNQGNVATLTATPSINSFFVGWSGNCTGVVTAATVLMDFAKTCTADFAIKTFTVTPSWGAGGTINPPSPQIVNYDAAAIFTVTPATGYFLSSLTGCNGIFIKNTYVTKAITSDCMVQAVFTGTPNTPIAPALVSFGKINTNVQSSVNTVTLLNNGLLPLAIGAITINAGAADYSINSDTCSSASLEPQSTCRVKVVFKPTNTGVLNGNLNIPSNNTAVNIALTGEGVVSASPLASISAEVLSFDSVTVGSTSIEQYITIKNAGAIDLIMDATTVSGDTANPDFVITNDTCSGATLKTSNSCSIKVKFRPLAGGIHTALLHIPSNVSAIPAIKIFLVGNGVTMQQPAISVSPDNIFFARIPMSGSTTQAITLTNRGTIDLNAGTLTVSGADSSKFSIINDTCSNTTTAPLANCTFNISFTPGNAGSFAGIVSMPSNDPNTPVFRIALAGTTGGLMHTGVTSDTAIVSDLIVMNELPGGGENFSVDRVLSFTTTGVAGSAVFMLSFDSLPSKPVIFKILGSRWKQLYPINTCAGTSNVILDTVARTLTFTISDNSECDSDPTVGTIKDPLAVTSAAGYNLSVNTTGKGKVTSSVGGINCGFVCIDSYIPGTAVTLTATPAADYSFTGWSGGACSGIGPCIITMNTNTATTALFTRDSVALTVNVISVGIGKFTGSGRVNSTPENLGVCATTGCIAQFTRGTVLTLTATADTATGKESLFAGWSGGGCSGTGICQVAMDTAKTISARFVPRKAKKYTLKVVSVLGLVTGTGISCGNSNQDCSEVFYEGTNDMVVLTAEANKGYTLKSWSGCDSKSGNTCNVLLKKDKTVTAKYKKLETFKLKVNVNPVKGGVLTSNPPDKINCGGDNKRCSAEFTENSSENTLILNAAAAPGYVLKNLTGCDKKNKMQCTVIMKKHKNVTATFVKQK